MCGGHPAQSGDRQATHCYQYSKGEGRRIKNKVKKDQLDSVGITVHFKIQLYFLGFGFLLPAFIHKSFAPFGAIVNGFFS